MSNGVAAVIIIPHLMCKCRLLLGFAWTVALAACLCACARFEPRPVSPAENADAFGQRSLSELGLKAFLEANGVAASWPRETWDLKALTLAAFYYHPDMDVARARWHAAIAAEITAGQRPNPSLTFTPRLNSSSIGSEVTPWIFGGVLDIPIETMGKRGYRVARAQHLGEMARFELASAAWLVRGRVRQTLLDLQSARETVALLRDQCEILGLVAQLVESQQRAGEVSPVDVVTARIAHHTAQLDMKDAQRQEADARGRLAEAIGVPVHALEEVTLAFSDLSAFPTDLTAASLRREAVLNRADVLGALAEYAASESALQLEIAKQYPDVHLRPGYELDQDENKWALGLSLELPILNQNQGPIAEAEAKRSEIAAKFNGVQAKAIGEIDRATAVYFAAVDQATTAETVLAGLEERNAALERMREAGAVDRLAVTTARAEMLSGAMLRLKARIQAQRDLAALENAVQSPLSMPAPAASVETATRTKPSNP